MNFVNSVNMYFLCIILSLLFALGRTASFTETVNSIVPSACKDSCLPWTNLIGPCVEKAGNMTFLYDPTVGTVDFEGNKLSLYFCLCSNDARSTVGTCATCISNNYCLIPAVTGETYGNVCTGNGDIEMLVKETKAGC